MDLQLKDKVVIVTGGAEGIGAAIARACSEEGAVPAVIDSDQAALAEMEAQFASKGRRCALIIADLSKTGDCRRAIQETQKSFGRIDALVNHASVTGKVNLENGSAEDYAASLERTLLPYYSMAHFALPYLKQIRGTIVNISATAAVTRQNGASGYASFKGAILALTREWAAELLPYEIRVNAVVGAHARQHFYRQSPDTFPHPEEQLKTIAAKVERSNRMTAFAEIAATAVFLLSPRASHMTGQHIFVTSGSER